MTKVSKDETHHVDVNMEVFHIKLNSSDALFGGYPIKRPIESSFDMVWTANKDGTAIVKVVRLDGEEGEVEISIDGERID